MSLRAQREKIDQLEMRIALERDRSQALADFSLHLCARIEHLEGWAAMGASRLIPFGARRTPRAAPFLQRMQEELRRRQQQQAGMQPPANSGTPSNNRTQSTSGTPANSGSRSTDEAQPMETANGPIPVDPSVPVPLAPIFPNISRPFGIVVDLSGPPPSVPAPPVPDPADLPGPSVPRPNSLNLLADQIMEVRASSTSPVHLLCLDRPQHGSGVEPRSTGCLCPGCQRCGNQSGSWNLIELQALDGPENGMNFVYGNRGRPLIGTISLTEFVLPQRPMMLCETAVLNPDFLSLTRIASIRKISAAYAWKSCQSRMVPVDT